MNISISIEKDVMALKARHEAFLKLLGGDNPVGCKNGVVEEVRAIGGFIRKYNGWFSKMENYIRGFLRQEVKPTADITLRLLQLSSSSISFIGVETDLYVTCYFSAIPGTFFDGIYAAYMTNAGMENPVCSIGGRLVCLKG